MKAHVSVMAVLFAGVMVFAVLADSEKPEIPPFSAMVELDITGEELQSEVYSYVTRELRSLGDVTVVSENGDWTIQIIAGQEHSVTGRVVGIAVSSVVLKHLAWDSSLTYILSQTKEKLSESAYELLRLSILTGCRVSNHQLGHGGPEHLQGICKKIVADFDSKCLKYARESHRLSCEIFERRTNEEEEQAN